MKRSITLFCTLLLLIVSAVPAFASKVIADIEYFYADDGTLIGKAFNGKRVNFEYDLRGQLRAVKDAQGKDLERYTYDPAGNRLSKTINGVTTTYTYDKANQLVTSTVNGVTTHYKYDAAGRMIQAGDKKYIYNGNNKVVAIWHNGDIIAKFEYNIDGQISKAIYGDKVEEFMWDGLALIWRSGVTYINEPYITGGNPVMAGDAVLFNDMLGSTLAINGKVVEMTSFGETGNKNAFFTGKPMIDELGYSFLFRDYNPNQGKWTTTDPLGYPDGWNNLAYVNNGVTVFVDWLGLAGTLIIVGEGGISGGMFDLAASTYQKEHGGTVVNVSSGQGMITAINNYVQKNGTIDSLQIFSHSSATGLYFDQGSTENSLYVNGHPGDGKHANVSDLSSSMMSQNATVKLWGCNTNATSNGPTIAQQIANQLQLNVEAASGPTVFSGVANGQPGQGLPNIVPADYKGGIYLVPQDPKRGFTSVKPE